LVFFFFSLFAGKNWAAFKYSLCFIFGRVFWAGGLFSGGGFSRFFFHVGFFFGGGIWLFSKGIKRPKKGSEKRGRGGGGKDSLQTVAKKTLGKFGGESGGGNLGFFSKKKNPFFIFFISFVGAQGGGSKSAGAALVNWG